MAIKLSEKQIKDGWQIVKFREIAKNISKRVEPSETDLEVYIGLEHLDPQSLRITRRGVPADVKGQKLRVRPGQIIFGKRRAYQKKVAVADFEGICSAHAMVLQEVVGKIIPGLLPFFMQSDMFMDRAVAISEGSLSPTIKWKTLAIQEFLLPPIERQKEILEVLEKLEDVDKKTKKSIKSLDVLLENIIVEQFKHEDGSVFLNDLCEEKRIPVQSPFDTQKKYVGFEHLEPVNIDIPSCGDTSDVVSVKSKFEQGNILYGKIRPYLRKAAIAPCAGLCSSDLIVIKAKENVSNVVIASILTSSRFSQIAMNSARGTKMPRADWNILLKTKLPESFKSKSSQLERVFLSIYAQKKLLLSKIDNIINIRNVVISGSQGAR